MYVFFLKKIMVKKLKIWYTMSIIKLGTEREIV